MKNTEPPSPKSVPDTIIIIIGLGINVMLRNPKTNANRLIYRYK